MPNEQPTLKKILIVEDELFISELYTRALSQAGYEPTVASDGKQAFELAESDQFDIILLDLMLPNMTGMDILRQLRGPQAARSIKAKIIVATNLEQKKEQRASLEEQADGYIIKANVTPRELVAILEELN